MILYTRKKNQYRAFNSGKTQKKKQLLSSVILVLMFGCRKFWLYLVGIKCTALKMTENKAMCSRLNSTLFLVASQINMCNTVMMYDGVGCWRCYIYINRFFAERMESLSYHRVTDYNFAFYYSPFLFLCLPGYSIDFYSNSIYSACVQFHWVQWTWNRVCVCKREREREFHVTIVNFYVVCIYREC